MKTLLLLRILALTFGCLLLLSSCGRDDGEVRYAYVTNGVDPFWNIAEAGAEAAAAELGVPVDVLMPAGGATDQKKILEDLLTRGTTGIAVSPIDAANQTDFLNEVAERCILVTHDSDAPDSDRRVFIGVDNYDAGRLCGELVKEALPDGGDVMIFVGRMEQDNARRRRQGVIDELLGRGHDPDRFDPPGELLEANGFTILGTLTDQFDRAKAKANAEDTLSRHPDIDGMIGLFAYNIPMILEALPENKRRKIALISFDEQDRTLDAIREGLVHGTVVQNPYEYGYRSVHVLHALAQGDDSVIPEDRFIHVPARQIRPDNVEEFQADLQAKLGRGE